MTPYIVVINHHCTRMTRRIHDGFGVYIVATRDAHKSRAKIMGSKVHMRQKSFPDSVHNIEHGIGTNGFIAIAAPSFAG